VAEINHASGSEPQPGHMDVEEDNVMKLMVFQRSRSVSNSHAILTAPESVTSGEPRNRMESGGGGQAA
jgi:hypothetical protein